ncbi:carbohydrate ABC transporter permease [Pseudonocardia sp. CA-107938]|uniref:carbohydrate ABC transporter permease n=1 Tax=Pseudonocardia sp. CA-107938 TaxID=3240021 RepID=UPI003D93EAF6
MSVSTVKAQPARPAPVRIAPPADGPSVGERTTGAFSRAFLVVWAIMVVAPLLWALLTSFKSDQEIFTNPWGLPAQWRFDNFVRAWTEGGIGPYFINSLIVVVCATLLVMLLGAMTAYVIARYTFPGRDVLYYAFIAGMAFPIILVLVPLFLVVRNLGLIASYPGLILVYVAYALPFTVFFLVGFFRTLPGSLIEAGLLDGCSHAGVFFRIMLPLARPGIISVGIFNFLGLWNQFMLPLVLMPAKDKYVLSQGLAILAANQGYRSDWSALFAGLVIAILPVLVVYAVFQRKIQEGLAFGGFK